ncbi:MAG: acetylglutamate kinase [Balneolales bacterium]
MDQQEVIPDQDILSNLKDKIVVIKYGGNAMIDNELKLGVMDDIATLHSLGVKPVVIHGGGPVIKETLDHAGIVSEFIGGHRKTDEQAMRYVEMALSGAVNGSLVSLLNIKGAKAVGLSGKDGGLVQVEKRYHQLANEDGTREVDLGHVGNVTGVDPELVYTLLENNFVPVIAPVSLGKDGKDYNINADMFAGNLAAALKAEAYVVLTDVDGLMKDIEKPESLIHEITMAYLKEVMPEIVKGGMIPKVESCMIALEGGSGKALIINGTRKHSILEALLTPQPFGTQILP